MACACENTELWAGQAGVPSQAVCSASTHHRARGPLPSRASRLTSPTRGTVTNSGMFLNTLALQRGRAHQLWRE